MSNVVSMWSDIEDDVLVTFVEKTVMNKTVEVMDTETIENSNARALWSIANLKTKQTTSR